MSDHYIRTQPSIEDQLKSLSVRYELTKASLEQTKMILQARTRELEEAKIKADHFDILMAAVRENEVVKGAWNKFTMALRLAGYDGQS